ncbi:MAG: hypothetical protein GYA24_18435 [Candidatus Lokiarchaeota archaeon]|nr:hypothetical protein [Candidatus Lokiarchaeota archaeon]
MGFLDRMKKVGHKATGDALAKLLGTITVYNQGGVPVVGLLDSIDEVSRKAMEGGFLVAITQFSNMKLADGDQMTTISFESRENGTFIVTKTARYIGSMLWQDTSGVPMDAAKEALAELLRRLEASIDPEDQDGVRKLVKDFISIAS